MNIQLDMTPQPTFWGDVILVGCLLLMFLAGFGLAYTAFDLIRAVVS